MTTGRIEPPKPFGAGGLSLSAIICPRCGEMLLQTPMHWGLPRVRPLERRTHARQDECIVLCPWCPQGTVRMVGFRFETAA